MDLSAQPSLITRLTQPSTLFAIACLSVSFLALRSAWKTGSATPVEHGTHKHTQRTSGEQSRQLSGPHLHGSTLNSPRRATVDRKDSISVMSQYLRSFYRILGDLYSIPCDENWFRDVRSVLERQIELCIDGSRDLEGALRALNDPLELDLDVAAGLKTATVGFASACSSFELHVQQLKQHEGAQRTKDAAAYESVSLSQFASVLSSVHETLATAKSLTLSLKLYARPKPQLYSQLTCSVVSQHLAP